MFALVEAIGARPRAMERVRWRSSRPGLGWSVPWRTSPRCRRCCWGIVWMCWRPIVSPVPCITGPVGRRVVRGGPGFSPVVGGSRRVLAQARGQAVSAPARGRADAWLRGACSCRGGGSDAGPVHRRAWVRVAACFAPACGVKRRPGFWFSYWFGCACPGARRRPGPLCRCHGRRCASDTPGVIERSTRPDGTSRTRPRQAVPRAARP